MVTRVEGIDRSVHTEMSSIAPRRAPATGAGADVGGAAGAVGEADFAAAVAGVGVRTGEGATGKLLLEIIRQLLPIRVEQPVKLCA